MAKKNLVKNSNSQEEWTEQIPPSEDLMREHGILNRILLIYEEIEGRLDAHKEFDISLAHETALIVRNFIEEYHEELEEKYIFPLFEKANKQVELVNTLWDQHNAGKAVTKRIIAVTTSKVLTQADRSQLKHDIQEFVRMYRPHEAREDTELFPHIRSLVTEEEFIKMGELFEQKEDELFGEHGFDHMVEKVAAIEKKLGINNLKEFTPHDVPIANHDED